MGWTQGQTETEETKGESGIRPHNVSAWFMTNVDCRVVWERTVFP